MNMRDSIPTKKIKVKSLKECEKISYSLVAISVEHFKKCLEGKTFTVEDVPGQINYFIAGFVVPVEFCKDV